MKLKLILLILIIFGFVYWRGSKTAVEKLGLNCNWHAVYAVCITDAAHAKSLKNPTFIDIMRAGINFKN